MSNRRALIPPRQIANGLAAWADRLHRTHQDAIGQEMRRAAAVIRAQADRIDELEAALQELTR